MTPEEAIAEIRLLPAALHRAAVKTVTTLGFEVEREAKALVSGPMLQVRTGVGRSSINTAVEDRGVGRGASATVGIGRTAPYMAIQHEGVEHSWIIAAVRARALRFEIGGETIFRRQVTHPPLAAHPFLRQPWEAAQAKATERLATNIAEELAT